MISEEDWHKTFNKSDEYNDLNKVYDENYENRMKENLAIENINCEQEIYSKKNTSEQQNVKLKLDIDSVQSIE